MNNYQGIMVIGENVNRLVLANYEDMWIADSLDMDAIVIGESRFQAIAMQSSDSSYGGPMIELGKIDLWDLLSIDEQLYDEISSEDIEGML